MQQLIFHHSCVLIMVDFWGSVGYGVSELGGVGVTHEGCSLPTPSLHIRLYPSVSTRRVREYVYWFTASIWSVIIFLQQVFYQWKTAVNW